MSWLKWAGPLTAIILLGLIAIFTRGFTALPTTYYMTGPSMQPAVAAGDWFLTRPLSRLPERGALVIMEHTIDDSLFHVLRRIVGLPGDTLEMQTGSLLVNGAPAPWPYRVVEPLADRTLDGPIAGTIYTWGPVVVGPDSVFVLSDTRDMIGWPDSRFIGTIPRSRLVAGFVGRIWGEALPSTDEHGR